MRNELVYTLIGLFCLLGLHQPVLSQESYNPFDLSYRLDSLGSSGITEDPFVTDNPFDLILVPSLSPVVEKKVLDQRNEVLQFQKRENKSRIEFSMIMVSLCLIVFIFIFFRSYIERVFRGMNSNNLLRQYRRDMRNGIDLPFILLYVNAFLCISVFLYFGIAEELSYGSWPEILLFFLFFLGVAAFFLFRHFLYVLTSSIFPIQKEVSLYNLNIVVIFSFIGICLLPIDVVMLFGPINIRPMVIKLGIGLLLLGLIYSLFRGAILSSSTIANNKFHFLLYICSVELAPLLILARFLSNQS